jgi:hypothetical protein
MTITSLKRSLGACLIALTLIASGVAPAALAQDDTYTVTIVGGVDEPQSYEDQSIDGFTITDFSYRSLYPGGMEFKATITPPEGVSINQVTLFYTFATGKGGRIQAELGDNPNEWIAIPYEARGLPPWHEIDAYWGIRAADGITVDSSPVHAVYYDASREWFRAESDDVLVYWYGMPEELGKYVIDAMAQNREKYIAGFGDVLPYRPMAVIFPPGPDWNEYKGDSSIDDTEFGFTGTIIPEAASTIQRVRTLEPAAIRKDCIWNPQNPTVEYQMNMAASTVTHEVAHIYQEEFGVNRGPSWWIEGQATFFETFEEYPVHERISKLAQLTDGPFPTLQDPSLSRGTQITYEDGCTHRGYDMGASFMKWLTEDYGDMEMYNAIVQEVKRGTTVEDALQVVTGKTFLELENEWRAFLGIPPVAPEQLDPALALGEPDDPYFEVGEIVTLPSTPFQQPMYNKPTEISIADAVCFANMQATILRAGSDGTVNWYEVDCMGMVGWMNQGQLVGP